MRISRDGAIQCRRLRIVIDAERWRRAQSFGRTLQEGMEREIAEEIGIEVTGGETFRALEQTRNSVLVEVSSNWAPPTRR